MESKLSNEESAVRHTFLFRLIAEETQRQELAKQRIKRLHGKKLSQGHVRADQESVLSNLRSEWAATLTAALPAHEEKKPAKPKTRLVWKRTRQNEWQRLA